MFFRHDNMDEVREAVAIRSFRLGGEAFSRCGEGSPAGRFAPGLRLASGLSGLCFSQSKSGYLSAICSAAFLSVLSFLRKHSSAITTSFLRCQSIIPSGQLPRVRVARNTPA